MRRAICAALLAVPLALIPSSAYASDGWAYADYTGASAYFNDTYNNGHLESVRTWDDAPDGYGVRSQSWKNGYLYGTYTYTGGAGTSRLDLIDAYEGESVTIQVCSRDKLSNGTVRIFSCGYPPSFIA
ncbi:hypothetical protein HII36_36070 [Nonomuraea sp. NN258]|uniref:hypothetical protein n=1 Tax=Nonomuraea antri TaxID=2730852 RepID=UPI001568A099|nr:hypothetical protein [Nonomuraea antri]NRQ37216.1 hypothetical protein [Nonomuraea antri]